MSEIISVEKASALYNYAKWLAENSAPCNDCEPQDSFMCDGCQKQLDWLQARSLVKHTFKKRMGDELSNSQKVQKLIHLYVERIRLEIQLDCIRSKLDDNTKSLISLDSSIIIKSETTPKKDSCAVEVSYNHL